MCFFFSLDKRDRASVSLELKGSLCEGHMISIEQHRQEKCPLTGQLKESLKYVCFGFFSLRTGSKPHGKRREKKHICKQKNKRMYTEAMILHTLGLPRNPFRVSWGRHTCALCGAKMSSCVIFIRGQNRQTKPYLRDFWDTHSRNVVLAPCSFPDSQN